MNLRLLCLEDSGVSTKIETEQYSAGLRSHYCILLLADETSLFWIPLLYPYIHDMFLNW